MANFLDKLQLTMRNKADLTRRSALSANWFRRKLESLRGSVRYNLSKMDADSFYNQTSNENKFGTSVVGPGGMFCYYYDAKWKYKLPYYDQFPLVMILGMEGDGFYGINFHYLPPVLRAKLLDEINRIGSDKINWSAVSKIDLVRPTVKRYLFNHVKSKVIPINDDEKEVTIFLPLEKFTTSKTTVWSDSKNYIKRRG